MPIGYTGMIWVAFRPSDDECLYNFPIPVEIQAVQALNALAEMERFIGRMDMAKMAETLGKQVKAGIEQYGIVDAPDYGRIYAYEVDGLGHANLMDDANMPSLLSAFKRRCSAPVCGVAHDHQQIDQDLGRK
jgi:uncharacterized protein